MSHDTRAIDISPREPNGRAARIICRPSELAGHTRVVLALAAGAALAACGEDVGPSDGDVLADEVTSLASVRSTLTVDAIERRVLDGEVVEWSIELPVGTGHGERIRIHRVIRERAPWRARPSVGAVMLVHGDASSFDTQFADQSDSLAVALARRDLDVWGIDRRWALLAADDDPASLEGQGLAVAIDDLRVGLALARAVRWATGHDPGPLGLVGFSRGAHLAYAYAGDETSRPADERHVDALVPVDFYARPAPDDEAGRQRACAFAAADMAELASGAFGVENTVQPLLVQLASTAPDEPSPVLPGLSNRDALLVALAATYQGFPSLTPFFHLNAGTFEGETPTGLAHTELARATTWASAVTPWQSRAEMQESHALMCGEDPPFDDHLESVRIPIFYVGAAGGIGERGRFTVEQLASTDRTVRIVSDTGVEATDVGHNDLVFGGGLAASLHDEIAAWLRVH